MIHCSFCDKSQAETAYIIGKGKGSDIYICGECTLTCLSIVKDAMTNDNKIIEAHFAKKKEATQ